MMSLPEPFLSAEINYRQTQVSKLYGKEARRRRRRLWVPRLPSLRLPRPAASLGGRGLSRTAE